MLSHVLSAALWGVEARLVHVEVDAAPGLPCFNVVGLPDTAVRESRDRVKSAVANSGFEFPLNRRLTANLAPAHLRKEGPGFDLPLALGLLAAVGAVPAGALEGRLFAGELSLDGSLRPIRGALGMALEARRKGLRWVALPTANAHEAAGIEGLSVAPLESLAGAVAWLSGGALPGNAAPTLVGPPARPAAVDFRDIKGQEAAKRALEVAAAGGHNILLVGPPGSGKTLLARGLAGILPEPREDEALEIALVRSSSGEGASGAHGAGRPFRDPHHTVSAAGLAGGRRRAASRGSHPGPRRCALPGRTPRIPQGRLGGAAPAPGGRSGGAHEGAGLGPAPGAVHGRRRDEPLLSRCLSVANSGAEGS